MIYREVPLREDGSSTLKVMASDPYITTTRKKLRPAIVVCPGGGYLIRATKEQEPVATRFLGMGFQVFILAYPTYFKTRPETWSGAPELNKSIRYPEQLKDLVRTMDYIHECADELDIDTNRIYVLGFSAGGHLAGSLAERWDDDEILGGVSKERAKPRGILMGYPMISADLFSSKSCLDSDNPHERFFLQGLFGSDEPPQDQFDSVDLIKNVRPDMPRVFLWHTATDALAIPAKSAEFMAQLLKQGVPCEYHLFQQGAHGNALADATSAAYADDVDERESKWVDLALSWIDMDVNQEGYSHE